MSISNDVLIRGYCTLVVYVQVFTPIYIVCIIEGIQYLGAGTQYILISLQHISVYMYE